MIDYNELMAWDKNDLAEYILTLLEEIEQAKKLLSHVLDAATSIK